MARKNTQKSLRDIYTILLAYGDLHIPRHDKDLQNTLLDIIEDIQPDIVLDGGDLICADCLSTYSKKHKQLVGLQYELDQAFLWMTRVNAVVPHAQKIILQDNHFWRRLEDRKKDFVWMEELNATTGRGLLRLEETGWHDMKMFKWKNDVMFVHGDDRAGSQNCPVNRSRAMVRNHSISVVRFHSHNSGVEVHNHFGETKFAVQLGTFEDTDHADSYMKHPELSNWSTSIGIFYLPKVAKMPFQFSPVFFRNGQAIFNGKIYGA